MDDSPSEPDLTSSSAGRPTRRLGVGSRVVLRYRDEAGSLTDALGDLLSFDHEAAVVRTRQGEVRVPRARIVTGKEVPPAPRRPGAPHRVIEPADLQEVMVSGMPPLQSAWLGRWLLRAADGYTGRANSVLPLGDPDAPLAEAVAQVERWYADRSLIPMVQIYGSTVQAAYAAGLGRLLADAGWQSQRTTLVMTAASNVVVAATEQQPRDPRVTSRVDETWLSGATQREQDHASTLTAVLDRIQDARYVTLSTDRIPDAIGRLALARGWAGIFAVHVQPARRRQGLARAAVGVLAREAQAAGARSIYLQVEESNEPAVELYSALGFQTHHEYAYARR